MDIASGNLMHLVYLVLLLAVVLFLNGLWPFGRRSRPSRRRKDRQHDIKP